MQRAARERRATRAAACLRATAARAAARAPPAPRARHAPPAPAHTAAPAAPPHAELPPSPSRCGLTHHAIIDVFCEMYRASRDRGARHAPSGPRWGRGGGGPARCVTHLSRRFLACSRSPPSAETCWPGSLGALGRAPPSHCDGVNALRETLRITSVKLNRAELSDICRSTLARSYFYLCGKLSVFRRKCS